MNRTSRRLRAESQKETDKILASDAGKIVVRKPISKEAKEANNAFKEECERLNKEELAKFDEQLRKMDAERSKTSLQRAGEKVKAFLKKSVSAIASYGSGLQAIEDANTPAPKNSLEAQVFNQMKNTFGRS